MLLCDLLEGKLVNLPFRWGTDTIDIPAIQNPTIAQVSVLFNKTKSQHGNGYIRGLMYRGTTLYIWDGWGATHDDAWSAIYPKIPSYSSDITTFHIEDDRNSLDGKIIPAGIRVERQGDYFIQGSKWEHILLTGFERSESTAFPKIY